MKKLKNELNNFKNKFDKSCKSRDTFIDNFKKNIPIDKNLFKFSHFNFIKTRDKIEFQVVFFECPVFGKYHTDVIVILLDRKTKSLSIQSMYPQQEKSEYLTELNLLKETLESFGFDFWIEPIDVILKTDKELAKYLKKINKLEESIKQFEYKNELKSLNLFLNNNKKVIDNDINNFLNKNELNKKFVSYKIRYDKIYFREVSLSVTNNGRKLFYNEIGNISKKEAVELLKHQIFVNDKNIKTIKKIPFINYNEGKNFYNFDLFKYLNLIKPAMVANKLSSF